MTIKFQSLQAGGSKQFAQFWCQQTSPNALYESCAYAPHLAVAGSIPAVVERQAASSREGLEHLAAACARVVCCFRYNYLLNDPDLGFSLRIETSFAVLPLITGHTLGPCRLRTGAKYIIWRSLRFLP